MFLPDRVYFTMYYMYCRCPLSLMLSCLTVLLTAQLAADQYVALVGANGTVDW